ncbi:aspartyl/asparaginyl beta-hydroxylase domain-containing protein [Paraburkholderia sp.]|jgi:hypothetical protein|uniref:aspartyl/asparaginyl beta-hydroxylase domain-containing protein n=1 Tax=Paraburkholderia sp. TaxID=1926495 RepID=UPI002F41E61D
MNSQIVGACSLAIPEAEIAAILDFAGDNQQYSEFHYGDWKTFVIWSQSGSDADGVVADAGLEAKETPRSKILPSLNTWIRETFDVSRLKLARIHSLGNGVLIPHKDFVEFEENARPWVRVHVPLVTNDQCLHSENDTVFRMRMGEVWFLDATNLHSAINLSNQRRLNLCLDFDLGTLPLRAIFNASSENSPPALVPDIVQRLPLELDFAAQLEHRGRSLTEHNFVDMAGWLAGIHFSRSVHIRTFFDWLIAVAAASRNEQMLDKAHRYTRFLQDQRSMGERFVL